MAFLNNKLAYKVWKRLLYSMIYSVICLLNKKKVGYIWFYIGKRVDRKNKLYIMNIYNLRIEELIKNGYYNQ